MERTVLILLLTIVLFLDFLVARVIPQFTSLILTLLFILLYTWIQTMAMVHRKRLAIKNPKPINLDYRPFVSVVIAAHNEAAVIEATVINLMALDYGNYELLVMDDRSTDDTPMILAKLAETYPERFRYHIRSAEVRPGKSAVLNDALAITKGDVLCVFDADAKVKPDFLTRIIPFLADESVGAVQARKIIANADQNLLTRLQHYEYSMDAHFQCGRESIYGAVELRGNGELIKRVAINEVHGWNEKSITDDLDISTKLHLAGWDIRFAHKVFVYEEGVLTFQGLLKQRRRWAEGNLMRYFEHASKLLTSPKISIRTLADGMAYMIQFMIPVWIGLDFVWMAIEWLLMGGDISKIRLLSSLLVAPVVALCVSWAMVVAIIRFNHRDNPDELPLKDIIRALPNALFWAAITGSYMVYTWFPITFAMCVKMLFQKERTIEWERTQKGMATSS